MPTPNPSRDKRIEALERRVAQLERQESQREAQLIQRTRVRLAKTFDDGSYPNAPANVLPIVFVDATFTETAGEQTLTIEEHHDEAQVVAMNLCERYLPDDTLCVVLEQNRRHFIVYACEGAGTLAIAVLSEDMCPSDEHVDIRCVVGVCSDLPTKACNPLDLAGLAGDIVTIRKITPCPGTYGYGEGEDCPDLLCDPDGNYESDEARWVIDNVQHHEICPVFKIERREMEDVGPFLIYAKGTISAMYCADELCGHDGGYLCCDSEGGSAGYEATDCMLEFTGGMGDNCCPTGSECCNWPEGGTPQVGLELVSTCSTINGQTGTLTTTGNRNSGLYLKEPPGDPVLTLCDGTTEFVVYFQCYEGTDGTLGGEAIPEVPDAALGKAFSYVLVLKAFSATNCCEILSNGPVYPYEASCVTGVFKFHAGTLRVTESCEVGGIPAGPCDCYAEGTCDYGDHDIDIIITQETTGCAEDVMAMTAPRVEVVRSAPKESSKLDCIYRGTPTRKLHVENCTSPPTVYHCAVHGECVKIREQHHAGKRQAIEQSGLVVCRECDERTPEVFQIQPPSQRALYPVPTQRNLIYHVCALAGNDTWKANLRQLAKRWDVFNGRRVLAIAQGEGIHSIDAVRRYLDELGMHARQELVLPNDPQLREVATFLPLLVSVSDAPGATFYGHTKGNSSKGNRLGAQYWRNALYHYLLDDVSAVTSELTRHALVGGCKSVWPAGRTPYPSRLLYGQWMYAGTFFWFRSDALFSKPNWRFVPPDRYGAEAYLSGLFHESEAATLYQPWPVDRYPFPNPYSPRLHRDRIRDE